MNDLSKGFMCYFCNNLITNDTRTGHSSVCANVLTPCPNKCGAYVCRKDLQQHQRECVNSRSRQTASLERRVRFVQPTDESTTAMQQAIQALSQRLSNYERRQSASTGSLADRDVEKLKYQSQIIGEWKKSVDFRLDTLKDTVLTFERTKNDQEIRLMSIDQKLALLDKLQMDMEIHIDAFVKEHNYNEDRLFGITQRLDEVKDALIKDQEMLSDQKQMVNQLRNEIEELKLVFNEQKAKLSAVSFEVKSVTHVANTAQENVEIQERELGEIRRQLEQLQFDFEILESLASGQLGLGAPITSPGHIVWRITDFQEKMSKAKQNNIVIKSQTFYTHDFGYKLRLVCFLNGLKKWKDRYALISLHIFKGEFDPLLKWPCHVQGTVTLRDVENVDKPNNFTKAISAKREIGDEENEEPQESSSSYIFIPHSTLMKPIYLKDDCIYLDVRIHHDKKLTETML